MSQLAMLVDGVATQFFPLDKARITIGRNWQCDIYIDDVSVSTAHAVIIVAPSTIVDGINEIVIEDQQSRNGTLVNDRAIHRCQLTPGDVITIGFNTFKLLDDRAADSESTALIIMD